MSRSESRPNGADETRDDFPYDEFADVTTELALALMEGNAAVATAHGHPPSPDVRVFIERSFSNPRNPAVTSLLRDLERGGPNEADHILGFLVDGARRFGIRHELARAALLHAKAQEQRRLREGGGMA